MQEDPFREGKSASKFLSASCWHRPHRSHRPRLSMITSTLFVLLLALLLACWPLSSTPCLDFGLDLFALHLFPVPRRAQLFMFLASQLEGLGGHLGVFLKALHPIPLHLARLELGQAGEGIHNGRLCTWLGRV